MGRRASGVWCVAIALPTSPYLAVSRAQRNQPVCPAYDGFLKNPDGSSTLSFAYVSHNAEVVTIPPGPVAGGLGERRGRLRRPWGCTDARGLQRLGRVRPGTLGERFDVDQSHPRVRVNAAAASR